MYSSSCCSSPRCNDHCPTPQCPSRCSSCRVTYLLPMVLLQSLIFLKYGFVQNLLYCAVVERQSIVTVWAVNPLRLIHSRPILIYWKYMAGLPTIKMFWVDTKVGIVVKPIIIHSYWHALGSYTWRHEGDHQTLSEMHWQFWQMQRSSQRHLICGRKREWHPPARFSIQFSFAPLHFSNQAWLRYRTKCKIRPKRGKYNTIKATKRQEKVKFIVTIFDSTGKVEGEEFVGLVGDWRILSIFKLEYLFIKTARAPDK